MNDLIWRDKAIEAIGSMPEGDDEWSVGCRNQWEWDTEALETMPPADIRGVSEKVGWVPTSVRPPEEFEYVFVQLVSGEYDMKQYIPSRFGHGKHPDGYWGDVDDVDYDYFDVVAWRLLPEQYKGN